MLQIILFCVGLLGVVKAADWFLSTTEKIGLYYRLPSFILGVVLIGFGTSLPELTTSIAAVVDGETGIAVANIVGSNIANILLILGSATVVLGTIRFQKNLIDIDLPLLFATTSIFILLSVDGMLSRFDGALLLCGFVAYLFYSLYYKEEDESYQKGLLSLARSIAKPKEKKQDVRHTKVPAPHFRTYMLLVFSVLVLGLSSKITVDALIGVVEDVGIAVGVVSFFALAVGTSLPELVVSIKALKRGQGDVVVGNIIGSNIFNMLLIGGTAATLAPQTLLTPSGYWMLAGMAIATILFVISGLARRIHIWEGIAFVFVYIAISLHILP